MGEIVVSDQKFRIKGDEPTEKEALKMVYLLMKS